MKKEVYKIMTLEGAKAAFEERMLSFRDAVFDLFLMPEESGSTVEGIFARRDRYYKDDCLTAFNRAWIRKVKRGRKLLERACLRQNRGRKYGEVKTRNDSKAKAHVPKKPKKKKPKVKKKRGRPRTRAPYRVKSKRKPGRPRIWHGARRHGHHATVAGIRVY